MYLRYAIRPKLDFSENVFTALYLLCWHDGYMNKQPFTHFDLPRQHLSEQGHYIPARAREEAEIQRRRRVPTGTVLAEQQAKGFKVAAYVLKQTEDESLIYSSNLISLAALNSGWYTFAQGASDVMRRRLYLPKMADHESDWRQNTADLRKEATENMKVLASLAGDLALRNEAMRPSRRASVQCGRLAGSTALQLAVLQYGSIPGGNAFEVQKQVRDLALHTLDESRNYGAANESHISIAQLADRDSPLSVAWRRSAPDQAYQALEEAHSILEFSVFSK